MKYRPLADTGVFVSELCLGASVDVKLTADEMAALNDVSALAPEYPAWMDMLPSDRLPGQERRWESLKR